MKNEARPGNQFLFHDNVNEFIEKSSVKRICSWVYSYCNAIKNRIKSGKNHHCVGSQV